MNRLTGSPTLLQAKGKGRRAPILREASFKDFEQIGALEARYGLTAAPSYEEWTHLWLGNPLYRELQSSWSIGWVLETEDSRIVGSLGSIPRSYVFEGKPVVAATSRGWVADPEFRSASLMLLDQLVHHAGADLFLTNTNSAASTAAVSALGCDRVPVGLWDEYVFWITNHRGYCRRFLTRKGVPLAGLLSYPMGAAISVKDWMFHPALRPSDVQVEMCSTFDERFDEFWGELRRRDQQVLLAVRTREVLDWHYKYALARGRVWIATVVDGPGLAAYAIFDKKEYPGGFTQVRLVDFQSLDDGTGLLPPLLFTVLRKCRKEGVQTLVNIGRWLEQGEWVAAVAPYRRRLPAWVYFYRAIDPGLADSLRDRAVWAPSLYDGDANLLR